MYETWHPHCDDPQRVKGRINYTVWSDIYICPQCGAEMAFWDVAVNQEKGEIHESWNCPTCATVLSKSPAKDSGAVRVERAMETRFDRELKQSIRQPRQIPVLINYLIGKKRFEKKPDKDDIGLLQRIDDEEIPYSLPVELMMFKGENWGDSWRAGVHAGLTRVHHFYTRRNLWILAKIKSRILAVLDERIIGLLNLWFNSQLVNISKLNRYRPGVSFPYNPLSGTLYISSQTCESTPFSAYENKLRKLLDALSVISQQKASRVISQVHSSTYLNNLPSNSLDYLFVDPPFGANLMYSELNFLWESWLGVWTNNQSEAVVNKTQNKELAEYQMLMEQAFSEFYRLLKPGRWMTVEFHNSQNSVWNSIQEGLLRAGFVIADVRVLDKQQETFKQATTTAAVKQDLIISAYKPNGNLEERFKLKAGTEDGAWEFVRYHLGKLPVVNEANGVPAVNAERQAFLLFDRMVAFHIQRGVMVPLSAPDFYAGLEQRFTRRDGMYFLPAQVAEYDRAVLDSGKPTQLSLFVSDEKTAITWLRQQLDPASGGEPKTQGDLTNDFNRVMNRAKHEQPLELIELLKQNFLQDEDGKWYVPDHNKASDLEKVRQRALLKEFKEYTESSGRLRVFRSEAVRAGFTDCFRRQDYETIIKVAERLPEDVLREDPDLLMYYDSALLRKK